MSITIPNFNTAKTFVGKNSYVYTVPTGQGGIYTATMQVMNNDQSGLTASITQAGSVSSSSSTTFTAIPTTRPSAHTDVKLTMSLADGDTVTYAITSSTAVDANLNTVKATLNLKQGVTN